MITTKVWEELQSTSPFLLKIIKITVGIYCGVVGLSPPKQQNFPKFAGQVNAEEIVPGTLFPCESVLEQPVSVATHTPPLLSQSKRLPSTLLLFPVNITNSTIITTKAMTAPMMIHHMLESAFLFILGTLNSICTSCLIHRKIYRHCSCRHRSAAAVCF